MGGLQDFAVRISEILDISEAEALALTRKMQPVLVLGDIHEIFTQRVGGLIGEPCIGTNQRSANAAQFSELQFLNPEDSGVRAFIDTVWVSGAVDGAIELRRFDTPLAALAGTGSYRNFRRGRPACRQRQAGPAAPDGIMFGKVDIEGRAPLELNLGMVIEEGEGFLLNRDAVNERINAMWLWREVT